MQGQLNNNNLIDELPCSFKQAMLKKDTNPIRLIESQKRNEKFTQNFIKKIKENKQYKKYLQAEYTIPMVIHVFHDGEEGRITEAQVQTAIDRLNTDFNGLNDDFNNVHPRFDSIKATLNINFCLAKIDPSGNTTTGIIYYNNREAMLNNIDLHQFAWDNYRYLNIYLPKYAFSAPSEFTAFAPMPNQNNSITNVDGITYSSYRFGYGDQSELEEGNERISIITHEVGHWLNLYHTFTNGCEPPGDYVDDTPPTLGRSRESLGCFGNNLSCNKTVNGSNYMDYGANCKKMFTKGQINRMLVALQLPERRPIWSAENLALTGCATTLNCQDMSVSFTGLPTTMPIENAVNLVGVPAGGTFSGPGVIFNIFNSSVLAPGTYTVNYTYNFENGCTASNNQTVLLYTIDFNFVNYNLGTVAPKAIDNIDLAISVFSNDVYYFEVFDINGKQVAQLKNHFSKGFHKLKLKLNNNLPNGVFFVNVSTSKYAYGKKFIR